MTMIRPYGLRRPIPALAAVWLSFLFFLPSTLHAQESLDEIMAAFRDVSKNGPSASDYSQALAFKHNTTLQNLAIADPKRLPLEVYKANQANFARLNDVQLQNAASQNGLRYTPQQTAPGKAFDPTPGTDTDGIFRSGTSGKPMTANQIGNARDSYNKNVVEFLEKSGVKTGGRPPNTNTSLLPDPRDMSESEWRKAIKVADRLGEVVYTDPLAAVAESKIRAGQPLSVAEANARVNQVKDLASQHFAAANNLDAAARKLPQGAERAAMEAEAQILRHNGAKYITRITETGSKLASQVGGITPVAPPSATINAAAVRDASNKGGAAAASAMSEHFAAQATQNYMQNLAKAAQASGDPRMIAQSQQAIAQTMKGLSPSAQGEALEAIRKAQGANFAQNVANAARGAPKAPPNAPPSKLGATLIALGGAHAIYTVAKSDDPSYTAGVKLGEFTGGTAGGMAGGMAGAKAGGALGAAIGSVIPGAGTALGGTVGALVGGLYGGYKGYGYGAAAGGEMGDTNSKYWEKNLPDEEFNKRAMANGAKTSDEVLSNLLGMGVPPERAAALAAAYKNGSLDTFNKGLKELREEMIAKNKWKEQPRSFDQLSRGEVAELLDCLCRMSLNANLWVYQGYNLTLPKNPQPQYSCDSLGNGPCMAQGFGCWRSFIGWGNPGISTCLAMFNLPTNSPRVLGQIDDKHQKPFEEPFTIEASLSPAEVCPGDSVTITVESRGGRGNTRFRYDPGWPLIAVESSPKKGEETNSRRVTFVVDPSLRRGLNEETGEYEYTRPLEAYTGRVTIFAKAATWDSSAMGEGEVGTAKTLHFRLRPHNDCDKTKPTTGARAKAPATTKKPTVPQPSRGGAGSAGAGIGPAGSEPSAPRPRTPTTTQPQPGATPADVAPPQERAPSGAPTAKEKKTEAAHPGQPVKPTPGVVATPAAPTEHAEPAEPEKPIRATQAETPREPGPTEAEVVDTEVGVGCDECMQIGGGSSAAGTSETDPSGETRTSLMASQSYWVEGCSGQTVRITVKGSDGWSGIAEGYGHRATVIRPIGSVSGTDEVTAEILSIPGCARTFSRAFAPGPRSLAESEARVESGTVPSKTTDALGGLIGTKSAKADQKTSSGLSVMGDALRIQDASTAGDQTLTEAKRVVDSAGHAAQDISRGSQQKIRTEDAKDAHIVGDAIISGIGSGLQQAGQRFGEGAGSHVAGEIFDSHRSKKAEVSSPAIGASVGGGAVPSSSGSAPIKSGASHPGGGGSSQNGSGGSAPLKTTSGSPPSSPSEPSPAQPQIFIDALCPVCGQMYNPSVGHKCPGATALRETMVIPPPATKTCEICGKYPGAPVTTIEGKTMLMCNACKGNHRCPKCGKYALDFHAQSFSYLSPNGVKKSGNISGVCAQCLAKWKKDNGLPP